MKNRTKRPRLKRLYFEYPRARILRSAQCNLEAPSGDDMRKMSSLGHDGEFLKIWEGMMAKISMVGLTYTTSAPSGDGAFLLGHVENLQTARYTLGDSAT